MPKKLALVVDDSPDWRKALEELLQERNYDVITAKDRHSALSLLSSNAFDVAVVDVNLTDEIYNAEGLLINREFKNRSPKTRVILVSARDLTRKEHEEIKPSTFVKKSHIYDALSSEKLD